MSEQGRIRDDELRIQYQVVEPAVWVAYCYFLSSEVRHFDRLQRLAEWKALELVEEAVEELTLSEHLHNRLKRDRCHHLKINVMIRIFMSSIKIYDRAINRIG